MGRSARRRLASWWRTRSSSASRSRATRTSCSRARPTRRRRARSRIPTAACSGCARRSAAPARCGWSGRCCWTWRAGSGLATELPLTAGAVFAELSQAVPFYRGLTLDEIGGDGLRWPEREESATAARQAFGDARLRGAGRPARAARAGATGSCGSRHGRRCGPRGSPSTRPSLRFLAADQVDRAEPARRRAPRPAHRRRGRGERQRRDRHGHRASPPQRRARAPPRCCSGTKENNANQLFDGAPDPDRDQPHGRTATADRRLSA